MSSAPLLGIEIGGTKLQLALGTNDGSLLAKITLRVDAAEGAKALRDQIECAAKRLLAANGVNWPAAVGVGFGGPLDARSGVVLKSNQVTGWEEFALEEWLRSVLHSPCVVVRNDSDIAALAEARLGAGLGLSPLLYLNSGSGIGGGLVIDGQLYEGGPRGALEIGHLWVHHSIGDSTGCRTLEACASGWAIEEAARSALVVAEEGPERDSSLRQLSSKAERVDAALVAEAAMSGDPLALAVLRRATDAISEALAHAVTLLAPRRVVLGGGVSQMPSRVWRDPIRQRLFELVFPPFRDTFDVQTAQLGQDVVLHGALLIAGDALTATKS